jgi:hypothetical protein
MQPIRSAPKSPQHDGTWIQRRLPGAGIARRPKQKTERLCGQAYIRLSSLSLLFYHPGDSIRFPFCVGYGIHAHRS